MNTDLPLDQSPDLPREPDPRPWSLVLGASLVGIEGVGLLGLAVAEVADATTSRLGLAAAVSLFFAIVGAALIWCARGLLTLESWARSPVILAQAILALTGWSFRGEETRWLTLTLAGVAVVVLACVLNPTAVRALAADGGGVDPD